MKIIAFHLPQFHPTPENDAWWGPGFTEWRNVAKARALYPGHRQPNLPGELSFYDLRLEETQVAQAELAQEAGVTAFCYYHYWFSGRLLLNKPTERMLNRQVPQFLYCICWANHSWTAHWAGRSNEVLIEQCYPGIDDERVHYEYLRTFFGDPRYLRLADRPVFMIFRPGNIPDLGCMLERLNAWSLQDGIGEPYVIGLTDDATLLTQGIDAIAPHALNTALDHYLRGGRRLVQAMKHRILHYPRWVVSYQKLQPYFENAYCDGITRLPTAIPNWDNTPRVGRRGVVLHGSSPTLFADHLRSSTAGFTHEHSSCESILLIKSWNEWAEGNYLEPDLAWGHGWLTALGQFVKEKNDASQTID